MKILLTGTHFTTALAVIEELKKQANVEIVYVGRQSTREGDPVPSVESQIFPKMGVKFIAITTGRLQRAFTIYTIPSLLKIPIGLIQALFIVIKEKPKVVLALGGYVSVPVVVASWLLSIPVIVHEQTLVSGLANTINSWFADKIAISFEANQSFGNRQMVLTGNPLRKEIPKIYQSVSSTHIQGGIGGHIGIFSTARKNKLPVILVTGGNQGSHVINTAIEGCLDKLLKVACVIHQTGDSKFKDFARLESKQNDHYLVRKFIFQEMPYILKNADLVVSRAGINTLSELAYLSTPALVIPLPYLYKDEQNQNAKFFEKLGLVRILPQSRLSGKTLLKSIKSCLDDLNHLKSEAKKAKEVIIPDAAKRLALETLFLNQNTSQLCCGDEWFEKNFPLRDTP